MKTIFKTFFFLFILITLNSCDSKSDCPSRFTPPNPFSFELVDKESGENLFTNGTYDPQQVQIIDAADDSNVDYSFISEDDLNIININTIGWESETINYDLSVSGNKVFSLKVDAERILDDCCSYTQYNEVIISDVEFELIEETGVYQIKL